MKTRLSRRLSLALIPCLPQLRAIQLLHRQKQLDLRIQMVHERLAESMHNLLHPARPIPTILLGPSRLRVRLQPLHPAVEQYVLVPRIVHVPTPASKPLDLGKDAGLLGLVVVVDHFHPACGVVEKVLNILGVVAWVRAGLHVGRLLNECVEAADEDVVRVCHFRCDMDV